MRPIEYSRVRRRRRTISYSRHRQGRSTNGAPDQSKHSNAKLVFENIEWLVGTRKRDEIENKGDQVFKKYKIKKKKRNLSQELHAQNCFNVISRVERYSWDLEEGAESRGVKSIAAKFESGLALRWYLSVKRGDLWAYCVSSMEIFFSRREKHSARGVYHRREVPGVLNDASKLAAR
ncbi:hypothetical protein PUN28_003394 [Cardiocondyla obscurior]|uniref:Uncharacterized protein n=1 Tax=Cardiocondyla obscurior TaxID=286306 RepID=A0AAW2GLS2_9HYME